MIGSFRAAGEEDIGVAKLNDPPGFADRVVGRRAGGDDAHVRPAQSKFHRDQAARHVADEHRNREGGDAAGPLLTSALCWSSSVFNPPMPLLTSTPKRSRFTLSRSMPESRIALFVAAIARWAKRSVRLCSLGLLKTVFGSKSRISPAIRQS